MKDQLKEALIAGDAGTVNALTQALLATGASPREILGEALLPGVEVVGERMRTGDCFIPEVLLSARTMQGALDLLRPHMAEGESTSAGTVVIGTVQGDVHDIGKAIVIAYLKANGYEVTDLGRDVPAPSFIARAKEEAADAYAEDASDGVKKIDALRGV